MQRFATCSFLLSCSSFSPQDQGRGQNSLLASSYLKILRFRCAPSQNKSLAFKKCQFRTLLCCENAALEARGELCTFSVNRVLRSWFLFRARDILYIYFKNYMLSIYKKKKKTEGESNGLSLLCKSDFGLFLS